MSRRQETRERIHQAAWELFRSQGFEQTTTREIASLAGVAVGSVFSHFPTKFDILFDGMLAKIDRVLTCAAESDEYEAPKLKLRHYAGLLYEFFLQEKEFSRQLWRHWLWLPNAFKAHKSNLKDRLCSANTEYDPVRLDMMFDCYVMTLIHGLNDDHIMARDMVRELSSKLALI